MRSTHYLLIAAALALASSFAQADALVNVKTETVRYDDIRMTSPVGIAVLYGRLRGAADRACAAGESSQDLAQKARFKACYDDALARAVASVNNVQLTAYYASKRGTYIPSSAVQSVTVVAKGQ